LCQLNRRRVNEINGFTKLRHQFSRHACISEIARGRKETFDTLNPAIRGHMQEIQTILHDGITRCQPLLK
jgi:hypothetical protein